MRNLVLKMMKYKLIISDYGETLVQTGKDVTEENIVAIKKYQENKGIFSIATGREWPSIKRKLNKPKINELFNMPIICNYGSLIIDSKTENLLFDLSIEIKKVIKLVRFLSIHGIPYSLVSKDNTLVREDIDLKKYPWKQYNNQIVFQTNDEIIEYIKQKDLSIYKIDIYNSFLDIESLSISRYFKFFYNYDLDFIEIVNKSAGKDTAYNFFKKYYELENNEVIVIGDAINDLDLFKNAVNRVAVSNAISQLIEKSTCVIDNSDYSGISRIIKKIL